MEEINIVTTGASAQIAVHEANTWMGMRRGQLSAAAEGEKDPLLWWAKAVMYPDCLACTNGIINGELVNRLTFDQYLALPDQITESWLAAVYTVNPHWAPQLPEGSPEQEKKA